MKDSKFVADCPVSLACDKKNLNLATSLFQAVPVMPQRENTRYKVKYI